MLYMAEGGQETEIMYKFGYDLPHFAMFTLLDMPQALAELRGMSCRYLYTAARHCFVALMGGRYSPQTRAEIQHRCIDFLREVAKPYLGQLPGILYAGIVGPRRDAYALNRTITTDEAEDYHSVQLETMSKAGVDMVSTMTFNNIPEAVGISRAVAHMGLPLSFNPGAWFNRVRSLRPTAAKMGKISLCLSLAIWNKEICTNLASIWEVLRDGTHTSIFGVAVAGPGRHISMK